MYGILSKALQDISSKLPLPALTERLLIHLLNAPADRQSRLHVSAVDMHESVSPDGDLKANLCAEHIEQRQLALRRKQPPRHAQADLEQHAALQGPEALALARRRVDAGEFGRLVFAGAGDAAVDERVGRELGTGFLGGAFEGEVGERGRSGLGREQAVEVLGC